MPCHVIALYPLCHQAMKKKWLLKLTGSNYLSNRCVIETLYLVSLCGRCIINQRQDRTLRGGGNITNISNAMDDIDTDLIG